MSAYVVQDEVINSIVTWLYGSREYQWNVSKIEEALAHQGTIGDTFPEKLGNAMFELNCNAVEQRYGDGEAKEFRDLNYAYRSSYLGSGYAVYDNLRTWLYQCAEGNVPDGELFKAMDDLSHSMAHNFFLDLRDAKEEKDAAIRRELRLRIEKLEQALNKKRR